MSHPLHLRLKNLLDQNTGEVLQHLKKIFAQHPEELNVVIVMSTELEALRKNQIAKRLTPEEENRQLNDLNFRVLSQIDRITPEEAATYDLENAIFKRILVVCKSAEREVYMRSLFPEEYYKGVEYDLSERPRPAASVNRFDLVVFDNTPHGDKEDPHELLKHYLEQTTPYVLYFGQPLPLLYNYPEKAYFANSVFSIHARIEEMVLYLKYRGRQL